MFPAAASLGKGDVGGFGDEEGCVEASGGEAFHDAAGKEAFLGVFQESAVEAALARHLSAVAIINEDFHS